MTIAVGFKCIDGVVLATDSQYTMNPAKFAGQKIFPIASNGHYALTIAGAGGVSNMKAAVRNIESALKKDIGAKPATTSQIQDIVEGVLSILYPKHLDSAPAEKREYLEFNLLVGIWTAQECASLFYSDRMTLNEVKVPNHQCLGIGSYLAAYLTDVLSAPGMSVEEAKPLAAYIVWAAKEYVEGVGGHTFVRVLLDNGADVRPWPEEVKDGEEFYRAFFDDMRHFRGFLTPAFAPEAIDMAPYAKIFRDRIMEFREKQKKRKDLQAKHKK